MTDSLILSDKQNKSRGYFGHMAKFTPIHLLDKENKPTLKILQIEIDLWICYFINYICTDSIGVWDTDS